MIKSYTEIRDDLIEGVVQNTALTNLNPGSVTRTILEALAKVIADLHQFLVTVTRGGFIQTAEGRWLDLKVLELGLTRKPGQKASGFVTVFRNRPKLDSVTIPAGTGIKTARDDQGREVRFNTLENVVLPADVTEVMALIEAETVGSEYNVGTGVLNKLSIHIAGIDGVTNKDVDLGSGLRTWQVAAGADPETDDELRKRAIYRWDELGVGGTADAYRSWALSVPGVKSVQILDDFPFGPGTVGLVITAESGLPTPELLSQVHQLIKGKKPLTAAVHVLAPKVKPVAIELSVQRFSQFEAQDIEDRLRQMLLGLNRRILIGEQLVLSQLIAEAMNGSGVYSVEIIEPAESVGAQPDELVQIEAVTIHQTVKGRSYQDKAILDAAKETATGVT